MSATFRYFIFVNIKDCSCRAGPIIWRLRGRRILALVGLDRVVIELSKSGALFQLLFFHQGLKLKPRLPAP
jgi:hypothetical protein